MALWGGLSSDSGFWLQAQSHGGFQSGDSSVLGGTSPGISPRRSMSIQAHGCPLAWGTQSQQGQSSTLPTSSRHPVAVHFENSYLTLLLVYGCAGPGKTQMAKNGPWLAGNR